MSRIHVRATDEFKHMVDVVALYHGLDRSSLIRNLVTSEYRRIAEGEYKLDWTEQYAKSRETLSDR